MKNSTVHHIAGLDGGFIHSAVEPTRKTAKYRNRKTVLDGVEFDSAKEARRWAELKLMERAGIITELKRQGPFILIPAQVRGGKVVEKPVKYIADFTYRDGHADYTVEDTKGCKNKEYIIKRKLMLWEFGIQVKEV